MPTTDYQGSSAGFPIVGRSILSFGRDHQLHSMEATATARDSMSLEAELDLFQTKVTDRLVGLTGSGSDIELLSVTWVRKLLDVFLCCQEDFRSILFNHKDLVGKPPTDRMVSDYFERGVKALDVCNAIRDGIEQIRQWHKFLEIVVIALNSKQRALGEGQFRRAKKALIDLAISMLYDKDSNNQAGLAHRNRSFDRNNNRDHHSHNHHNRQLGVHFRSLSWSVSRSWSAMRQLQGIAVNIVAPKSNEIATTYGLAVAIYTINSVLLFVMWALVAAIPCQDRGLAVHFYVSRSFSWAGPIMSLHEKIMEESKKGRKNACGLLREIHQIEKFSRVLSELTDSITFPLTEEKENEVRQRVKEVSVACEGLKDGLDPLERQVRDVFHRIVRSRTEGLDSFGRMNHYV